jgi:uncharacterized Fe-S cluster protein YjdI
MLLRAAVTSEGRGTVTREYKNSTIVVQWDAERCIHFGNCVRNLPSVFNSSASPWIELEGADADEFARVVVGCPSGALHFRRLDGGPEEQVAEPSTVRPMLKRPAACARRHRDPRAGR